MYVVYVPGSRRGYVSHIGMIIYLSSFVVAMARLDLFMGPGRASPLLPIPLLSGQLN